MSQINPLLLTVFWSVVYHSNIREPDKFLMQWSLRHYYIQELKGLEMGNKEVILTCSWQSWKFHQRILSPHKQARYKDHIPISEHLLYTENEFAENQRIISFVKGSKRPRNNSNQGGGSPSRWKLKKLESRRWKGSQAYGLEGSIFDQNHLRCMYEIINKFFYLKRTEEKHRQSILRHKYR